MFSCIGAKALNNNTTDSYVNTDFKVKFDHSINMKLKVAVEVYCFLCSVSVV